jgi:hypothetical protein
MNKKIIPIIICIIISLSSTSVYGFNVNKKTENLSLGTEYWGLLFAVGEYKDHPEQNRPSMLDAVSELYDTLVAAPEWAPDHINIITGRYATGINFIKGLIWLIQNEDSNDYVLIYITTHGSPLKDTDGHPIDIPPRDERDGADEILVMYEGFSNPYAFIWDDLLNLLLSFLEAKGVCLIVDSCFSGGFNDYPYFDFNNQVYTQESYIQGLAEELATQKRVVLMSSEEDTYSYGSLFSNYLINGFEGMADIAIPFGNYDGINSAEESFQYAQALVDLYGHGNQHPTILDLYPGEFPVTS